MKEHFGQQMENVRRQLVFMGSEVEKQIRASVDSVINNTPDRAREVIGGDAAINELEVKIEDAVVHLFALQQPVAIDLRFLIAVLKINNDLERIADHAVNIANCAVRISELRPSKVTIDLRNLGAIAMSMLSDTLKAFVTKDAGLARKVIERDDDVDSRYAGLIRELLTYMAEDPTSISRGIELISVAKNLERVADLATNIAEDTIFIAEARQVKHLS
jgi:phosphate transport system protein